MKSLFILFLLLSGFQINETLGQNNGLELPLYEYKIPNEIPGPNEETIIPGKNLKVSKVRIPTLSVFLPAPGKATGAAVVICPGGGYAFLNMDHEGSEVARKLNEYGIAAFVLKYRLPDAKIALVPELAPLQDAQQALLLIRKRAKEWGINPGKVGIMGFSAGGHLAATVGTHFPKTLFPNPQKKSVRPDFMVLVYAVTSADAKITHQGSFDTLLGMGAPKEKVKEYSNELQITPQTPPAFLVHADNDKVVNVENSRVFYQNLIKNKVPAELHIYPGGGHGFGLHNKTAADDWFDRCISWMGSNGWLKK